MRKLHSEEHATITTSSPTQTTFIPKFISFTISVSLMLKRLKPIQTDFEQLMRHVSQLILGKWQSGWCIRRGIEVCLFF